MKHFLRYLPLCFAWALLVPLSLWATSDCYEVCMGTEIPALTWCPEVVLDDNCGAALASISSDVAVPQNNLPLYAAGQLYVKVKSDKTDLRYDQAIEGSRPTSDAIELLPIIAHYGITRIEKAFARLPKLNRLYVVHFTSDQAADALVAALAAHRLIAYAEKKPQHRTFLTPNDIHPDQWNVQKIAAELAWDLGTGSNQIVIGMVDDAVRTTHEDLAATLWINPGETAGNGIDDDGNGYIDDINGWDAASNDNNPNPEGADNFSFSHGTHCAGIAAAATNNGIGVAAISYNVRLMAIKTALTGDGSVDAGMAGVEYAIATGADVISLSWGGGAPSDAEQEVFDLAYEEGIVCVAAAGNDNTDTPMYPASYNHVISVGATDEDDAKADFSNYGATIDVMSPGVHIWSPVATTDNSYEFYDGTSMACPLVSGLCALMLSYMPTLTVDQIENCLETTADNINAQNPDYIGQIGAGRINAHQAMLCIPTEPVAQYQTDFIASACIGQPVQFHDNSGGLLPLTVQWVFEGGIPATSTDPNPLVFYTTSGTFDVTLTATNPLGTDTYTGTITIAPPTATLSGGEVIIAGYQATLTLEMTGTPPWDVTYTDGTNNYTLNNIMETPFEFQVAPAITTNYSIVNFVDSYCTGIGLGSALVVSDTPVDCVDCPYNLIQEVLLGGGCVAISNIVYTGDTSALGYFEQTAQLDIGFGSGILLSTGYNSVAYAPNDSGSDTEPPGGLDLDGDPDLDELITPYQTYDASILEFDFIPSSDAISFNYVFGSEEYPEFVCSQFTDVFAFFISGPGIVGQQNIALIPSTTLPVAINSVNPGVPGFSGGSGCISLDYEEYYIDNEFSDNTQFDGYTVPLTAAISNLTACEMYHIKIAIADAGDHAYDSGVFLEANSFTDGIEFDVESFGPAEDSHEAYEGCDNGYFMFYRTDGANDAEAVTIEFTLTGSATIGADYVAIPTSVTIPAGQDSAVVFIQTIADNWAEGFEAVTVVVNNIDCGCSSTSVSATLYIRDNDAIDAGSNQAICPGESAQLQATSGLTNYAWTPAADIDNPNIANPIASPTQTTLYYVTATDAQGCIAIDSVLVFLKSSPYVPPVSLDTTICTGTTADIKLTNLSYIAGYNYSWSPIMGLDNPNIPAPTATVSADITYTLTLTNPQGCSGTTSVSIEVANIDTDLALSDTAFCAGESAVLAVPAGFSSYVWSSGATTNSLNVSADGVYSITVTDATYGCAATAQSTVTVHDLPQPTIAGDTQITEGSTGNLETSSSYASYLWSNGSTAPSISVTEGGTYAVTVSNEYQCIGTDAVTVSVEPLPVLPTYIIPSAFSPNGDGVNDVFQAVVSPSVAALRMVVYNRWGNKVFSAETLDDSWNGKYNGMTAEMGVYVYTVELTLASGEIVALQGNVTLLR